MNGKSWINLYSMRWSKGSGGRWKPSTLVRGSMAVWLAALALIAAPMALVASAQEDPAQGAWSLAEAEYKGGMDSSGEESGSQATASEAEAIFDDDPAQGAWSLSEAMLVAGLAGSEVAANAAEAVFDDDPAQGASSLAEAMYIAGLGGSETASGNARFRADPVANAWSLAEAEFIFVNQGQEAMSGRVYWVPDSFCSAC